MGNSSEIHSHRIYCINVSNLYTFISTNQIARSGTCDGEFELF